MSTLKQAVLDFYDAPIEEVRDETRTLPPTETTYCIRLSDREAEYIAHGLVPEDLREQARTTWLKWKDRYWHGTDADAAYELYLELKAYGLLA